MNKEMASSIKNIAHLSETASYTVLGLHIYYQCYWLFDHWGLTNRFTDEILDRMVQTGLLDGFKSRVVIIFFLALALASATGRKTIELSRKKCLRLVAAGGLLFCCSPMIFVREGDPLTTCLSYIVATLTGYLLLMTGGGRLFRLVKLPWDRDDPFGRKQSGFPQERRRLEGPHSLHLSTEHTWKGEKRFGWVNLINPRRGILIMGSPGSGKSWFIIEPLMKQLMEKGHALFVYDFKFPALTNVAYRHYQAFSSKYPPTTKFFCIQFGDLSRSHRCNLLAPSTLQRVSDALGASRTILLSMNKTWINKQGEFFVESPINFLGALIWFLRKYKEGQYCSLPHAIELAQTPYERLFPILSAEAEIKTLIDPFADAYRNKSFEMLDGQIASARIPLARISSPDLYYILTGDDLNLEINDPAAPKIVCLGGDPTRQEALGPVLSLYIDRLNRLCNRPKRYPCAMICDEFGTVRAYSMTTTIATGRANNIVPILAVQDISQLRTQYSRDEADLFLNITGNVFCGQVGGDSAKWVCERFPRIQQEKPSISANSTDTSVSTTLQWEPTVNQATIAGLSAGEFVGVLSDDPDKSMELKVFHARILREEAPKERPADELPIVREVDEAAVRAHFQRIKEEIKDLVAEEYDSVTTGGPEAVVAINRAP
jgi:hypothetical protein